MPAAASTVPTPPGEVVGAGTLADGAVSFGEAAGIGVRVDAGVVAGTGVSGGAVTTKVCISTAEDPYGYSPDLDS